MLVIKKGKELVEQDVVISKKHLCDKCGLSIFENLKRSSFIVASLPLRFLPKHNIAVISLDRLDFRIWCHNRFKHCKTKEGNSLENGRDTYICISRVTDLCSLDLDEVIETDRAKENKEYQQIKTFSKYNLSVN